MTEQASICEPSEFASLIYSASSPILKILALEGPRWKRNVKDGDPRTGPWLRAQYEVMDQAVWMQKGPCLYMVGASDSRICYVGKSTSALKIRWKTAPAFDADTLADIPHQLFHSQCWKHMEVEMQRNPGITFEVRSILEHDLVVLLHRLIPPLPEFAIITSDGKMVIERIEHWFRKSKSSSFALLWHTGGSMRHYRILDNAAGKLRGYRLRVTVKSYPADSPA